MKRRNFLKLFPLAWFAVVLRADPEFIYHTKAADTTREHPSWNDEKADPLQDLDNAYETIKKAGRRPHVYIHTKTEFDALYNSD